MPDVVQPVAELLQEFALNFLSLRVNPERLEGNGNMPRWLIAQNGPIYGVYFTAETIPPYLGRTTAIEPDYLQPLIKLTFVSATRTGQQLTVGQTYVTRENQLIRLFNGPYTTLIYEILPGCSFFSSYLVL